MSSKIFTMGRNGSVHGVDEPLLGEGRGVVADLPNYSPQQKDDVRFAESEKRDFWSDGGTDQKFLR